jgi:hypothetical protein
MLQHRARLTSYTGGFMHSQYLILSLVNKFPYDYHATQLVSSALVSASLAHYTPVTMDNVYSGSMQQNEDTGATGVRFILPLIAVAVCLAPRRLVYLKSTYKYYQGYTGMRFRSVAWLWNANYVM